jgi:hypothetical protein
VELLQNGINYSHFATGAMSQCIKNLMATTYSYTGERDSYRSHQVTLEVAVAVAVANTPAEYKMTTIVAVKKVLLWRLG